MATSPFIAIIEQHADEVAFLWLLHSQALRISNPNPERLAKLKERINAHIKGLILAGHDGWNCCVQALETYREAGEVFAASVLALNSSDRDRMEKVLEVLKVGPEAAEGLIAAISWRSWRHTCDALKFARLQAILPERPALTLGL